LERLTEQLAVLQRRGLVDVWSDELIAVGDAWEPAIERALSGARIAVLLVSPSYLASDFIWTKEMPRIVAHAAQGMEALPLIVRPCAWKLEAFLANLQARPRDGRALSLGNESQIDMDLSSFVGELANKIGHGGPATATASPQPVTDPPQDQQFDVRGEWVGRYGNRLVICLTVDEQSSISFSGSLAYGDGTRTQVQGTILPRGQQDDAIWKQIDHRPSDRDRIPVTFRETGYLHNGDGGVDFNGEYLAYASDGSMRGAWISQNRVVGSFVLERRRH
jgi:hypothetical protein